MLTRYDMHPLYKVLDKNENGRFMLWEDVEPLIDDLRSKVARIKEEFDDIVINKNKKLDEMREVYNRMGDYLAKARTKITKLEARIRRTEERKADAAIIKDDQVKKLAQMNCELKAEIRELKNEFDTLKKQHEKSRSATIFNKDKLFNIKGTQTGRIESEEQKKVEAKIRKLGCELYDATAVEMKLKTENQQLKQKQKYNAYIFEFLRRSDIKIILGVAKITVKHKYGWFKGRALDVITAAMNAIEAEKEYFEDIKNE